MKNFKIITLALSALVLFSSCNNDDEVIPVNEEELITTVRVTLLGGGQTITMTSTDLDGDGPALPSLVISGNLIANTTYAGTVKFLNELQTPVADITAEVEAEGVDHQVFYQLPAALGTITYTDLDVNGNPIGLNFSYLTGNAGTGNLTVTLRHLPNKTASGVSTGNIANAGGSTDAEVSFPFVIN